MTYKTHEGQQWSKQSGTSWPEALEVAIEYNADHRDAHSHDVIVELCWQEGGDTRREQLSRAQHRGEREREEGGLRRACMRAWAYLLRI